MNFRRNLNDTSPGFQMAPMIDIIFILLVHFMAATLFAKWETKLEIKVPSADHSVPSANQRLELIINVDKEGIIYINSVEISYERLKGILATTHQTSSSQPIIIRADQNTRHKDVMKILDLCSELDIRNVAFATIKLEEEKAP